MKLFEVLSSRFSIQQIFLGLVGLLTILLVANFLAFRAYNVDREQLAQYHHITTLRDNLSQLSPAELGEMYSDEHYRELLIASEKMLDYLVEGGYAIFLEGEVYVTPPSGSIQLPLERIHDRWPEFRAAVLEVLTERYDNVSGEFSVPLKSDLGRVHVRMMELANEMETNATYVLLEQKRKLPIAVAIISVLAVAVFILMIMFVVQIIIRPLKNMAETASELAKGQLQEHLKVSGNTEVDYIAKQINGLAEMLENALDFTKSIGDGKLEAEYSDAGEGNRLAQSLLEMRKQMKDAAVADYQRNWTSDGLAKFAEILRLESDDLSKLSYNAISNLVKYVGAQQGSIFIVKEEDGQTLLEQRATFAYDKQKFLDKALKPGDGLVGQVYLERKRIYLLDVPDGYLAITAGLGQTQPRCLLVVPLIYNDEIQGIVEIASLDEIPDYKVEFVESVGESIAANISTVKNNERTRSLLRKSQEITEKMQAQEDEMRKNMSEMQATYREMISAQEDTERKEANLNALINNTEDSIVTIDQHYQVMIINDVLKRRYKGTQYEGIDVGQNVLDTLGAVREEWKGYYDRALAGERLDFVIQSTVNNEYSFRRYHINPVRNHEDTIIGCSVFSRDVTDQKVAEMENRKLITDLTQKNKLFEAAFYFVEIDSDKEITTINELAALELGYGREELIGRDINDLFVSRDTMSEGISTMHQGDIWKEEVALLTKEGKRLKVKSVSTAVIDHDTERIAKYILIFYKA